jgi:hypothetical protein
MCTVILLHRPGHGWPVLIAANRDERLDRAWDPPAAWWPGLPGVVGGRDRTGGGTWLAANAAGLVATVLNRPGSLGPAPDKLSRGELPLRALEAEGLEGAVGAVAGLDAGAWRPFNAVVAGPEGAAFLRGRGVGAPDVVPLPAGLHMVTAQDPNDLASPRIARHLPRFRAAPVPDPETGDWAGWEALLADDGWEASLAETLFVPPTAGFGTICSSLLAIRADGRLVWRFAGTGLPLRFAELAV